MRLLTSLCRAVIYMLPEERLLVLAILPIQTKVAVNCRSMILRQRHRYTLGNQQWDNNPFKIVVSGRYVFMVKIPILVLVRQL